MRDITLCHPKLQSLAKEMVNECSRQGLKISIGETLRTKEEQDALYAQGRTKPGNIVTNAPGSTYSSFHQWGTAFDIYRNDGTGSYNEAENFFEKAGAIGVSLGLEWGGNWKSIKDKPHFQLPDWGSTTAEIKKKYGTPDEFIKTWSETPQEGFLPAMDGERWWYQYADKTFAKAGWYWLTEATSATSGWYLFDGEGYMLTGYRQDLSGDWFFLCPDKGINEGKCMVTDGRGALKIVGRYDFENHKYAT